MLHSLFRYARRNFRAVNIPARRLRHNLDRDWARAIKFVLFGGHVTITVKKVGGGFAVVIPRAVAREMKLDEGTPLSISTSDDAIVMRRQSRRPRRSVGRIVAQIKPASYRRRGGLLEEGPVGTEVW